MAWYKLKPLLKAANCTSGWEKESYMPALQLFKTKLLETLYSHKEFCKQSTLSNLEEAWGRFRIGHHLCQPQKHQWICAKDGFWVCWAWSTSVLGPHAFVRMTDPLQCFHKWQKSWRSEAAVAPLHYLGKTHRTDRARHRTTNATNRMALTALAPKSQICRSPILRKITKLPMIFR